MQQVPPSLGRLLWLMLIVLTFVCVPVQISADTFQRVAADVAEFREHFQDVFDTEGQEVAIGYLRGTILEENFSYRVRMDALDKYQQLAPRENLDFELFKLGEAMPRSREQFQVFQAYWKATLGKESDSFRQICILLEAVKGRSLPSASRTVQGWAADQLCDRGIAAAWPDIVRVHGSDLVKIRLCEEKFKLLEASCGDLTLAMAEALKKEDPFGQPGLHQWALQGLQSAKTEEADAILLEYLLRLNGVDWYASRSVAYFLKQNGWTDEDLLEKGWNSTPPCLRIPRECPPTIPDPKP
jgi:hypothetical protein